ncbi:MAG TPA: rhodanese-like domain-containing protein [Blastocatellia bacterium]|nr:rhodanese-like domain-containing protein [Blastocatellia bacterium]
MADRLDSEAWTSEDLLERPPGCDNFFVLDVRNRDEFDRFRLEGRGLVPAVNVPYFEIHEPGTKSRCWAPSLLTSSGRPPE